MYAHRGEMEKHAAAKRTIESFATGRSPWAIPVFCLGEFLRVVTHPRLFSPPTPQSTALLFIQRLMESPGLSILSPGPDFPELMIASVQESGAVGNVVFDAMIVAVCRESGVNRLLTEDRDFDRFREMNVLRLN